MHWLFLAISIVFALAAATVAYPQTDRKAATSSTVAEAKAATESPPAKDGMSPAEIRKKSDTYYKQCMNDWDAATHMTKEEWQRTCRRITDERSKFLIEQMGK